MINCFAMDRLELEERIVEVLRTVFDPEIPVNIYDLGLIGDSCGRGLPSRRMNNVSRIGTVRLVVIG